jgi:hypothetical protein
LRKILEGAKMSKRMKIAINTGGEDAPGLNSVIEAWQLD